jgi:hypothetical protein
MRRREFLSGLGGAAVWPLAARATLLGSPVLLAPAARAVDRGQYDNVPDNIRSWFKGVRNSSGALCCDISDGNRTDYEVRAGAYWVPISGVWWGYQTLRSFAMPAIRWARPSCGTSELPTTSS